MDRNMERDNNMVMRRMITMLVVMEVIMDSKVVLNCSSLSRVIRGVERMFILRLRDHLLEKGMMELSDKGRV